MCPICRSTVPQNYQLSVTVALRNAIDRIFKHHTDYQQRKEEAHRSPAVVSSASTAEVATYTDAMHDVAADAFERIRNMLDQIQTHEDRRQPDMSPETLRCFLPVTGGDEGPGSSSSEPFSTLHPVANRVESGVMHVEMTRLCRKSGIYAENVDFLENCSKSIHDNVWNMLTELKIFSPSRRTHTVDSVYAALKPHHTMGYGKGGVKGIRYILSPDIVCTLSQVHPTMMLTSSGLSTVHDINVDIIDRIVALAVEFMSNGGGSGATSDLLGSDIDYSIRVPVPVVYTVAESVSEPYDIYVGMAGPASLIDCANPIDGCPIVGMTGTVLTLSAILAGGSGFLIAELLRHATSECMKALTKLSTASFDFEQCLRARKVDDLRTVSNLQYSPVHVALVASRLHNVTLTPQAAVALSCFAEYLTAEVLELSGNAAREQKSRLIDCEHVDHAIRYDSELDHVFPGDLMSAHPYVVPFLLRPIDETALIEHWGPLTQSLINKAKNQPHGIIIDPLSGRHIQLSSSGSSFNGKYLAFLDAASELCAYDRAQVIVCGYVTTRDLYFDFCVAELR